MTGGGMCAAQQPQGALVADLVENLPGHRTHMDIKPAQQAAVARDISSRGTTACLVGDAPQNAGLPRDASQPAACEYKCAFRHGSECARPSTCARSRRLNLSFVPPSTGR